MTSDPPPIRWSPSPRSLTCELGRVGTRTLFSIIDRRYEFALHPQIPGRDGITLRSEAFEVHDQPPEAARERAGAR
ncbi:MAG TPA: hypothetical protein VKZ82_20415 [Nonomuraea sp.]|uniref:hypothetical protein n=1 Tax=Nonomuraea sp. NPDC049649 TaxID=3155776 RepID=UPI002BD7D00C|nr:hypothetical protein [Nonomuraea sp.]